MSAKARPVSKSQIPVTLNEARTMLVAALGENSQNYFKHVQDWFKLRTSKEVIDSVARRYLKHDKLMYYHEVFILTLLNEVGGLEEESQAAANQMVFPEELVCPRMSKHYRPVSPVLPFIERDTQLNPNEKADQNGKVDQNDPSKSLSSKTPPLKAAVNVAQEACLPSPALVHGRLLLASWDTGLLGVHSDAAELVLEATKTLLKNVLTAIVNDIKPFKRCTWSHMFHVQPDARVRTEQIWWREGEKYDKETLIEECERNAIMNLLPREMESNAPPEYYVGLPTVSASYGAQPHPEEAATTLTACNVFHSLRRNPHIIPVDCIFSRTIMRASVNMRQSAGDKDTENTQTT